MTSNSNSNPRLLDILEQLKAKEPIFHHPEIDGTSKEEVEKITDPNFWEVGASGNIYNREMVISTYVERYKDDKFKANDTWETKDFGIMEIAPDNYLLTYTLIQNRTRVTRRSKIWRKISYQFKILYHQGTIYQENEQCHQN